jgi:3-methyladenine DNA glycosylase AlkC
VSGAVAEPFKNLLNDNTVRAAARHLQRAWPAFDARAFERLALTGLDALEMKARAMHIADALEASLPPDFAQAAALIEASLAPPLTDATGVASAASDAGLVGWVLWPVGEFIVRRGMAQPERALAVLRALTQRFTAEWALRPFIVAHPALCWATLARWARDPSLHVRRLASEGSRPRLPWGLQLKALIDDPSPTLPLMRALQDDPSDYVRRSVANHLNDIAKDHPALVAAWVEEHLAGASKERRALLKHASRTLIKNGDARMFKAWGLAKRLRGQATLALAPKRVSVGGSLSLSVTLRSDATRAQPLVVDYAVHHVKANGGTTAKVFKGWVLELAAGETRVLGKTHSLRPITTRRYHAGRHGVELRVNGETLDRAVFDLKV